MTGKQPEPKDVESYIANADSRARATLRELRALIKTTIPGVEEGISYGVPFYKYHGALAGFSAYRNHVSFGIAATPLEANERARLASAGYKTGKVTLQITFDQAVPVTELTRMLEAKAALNERQRRVRAT